MRRLIFLAVVAALAAGCGHGARSTLPVVRSSTSAQTTAAVPTTKQLRTSQVTELLVKVYFLRDGKIAPVARTVSTWAVATAALQQLDSGLTPADVRLGLTDSFRGGVALRTISNGVALIDQTEDLSHAALAQVVYTLTQFPTVHGVRTQRMLGDAKPLTRADFEDVTPAILVESPLPGETVTSPLRVSGTANTFEATFDLEIRNSSGVRVAWRFVTASSGSGTRGTYDTTISFPHTGGPLTLVAYEPSAENGKPLHIVRIPLHES